MDDRYISKVKIMFSNKKKKIKYLRSQWGKGIDKYSLFEISLLKSVIGNKKFQ